VDKILIHAVLEVWMEKHGEVDLLVLEYYFLMAA
jgi:hypothetical protein